LTYGDDLLFEATKQIFDRPVGQKLEEIAHSLQQEHAPIHTLNAEQRKQLILEFVAPAFREKIIGTSLNHLKELNEPCLEAFHALGKINELPTKGANIFYSTATAASGDKNAWHKVFDILGITEEYTIVGSSTICEATGKTGVSHVRPYHANVVKYNQTAKPDEWPKVIESLVTQFCNMTKDNPDYMFHWGCISQNKQPSNSFKNQMVSSWSMHEHWNLLMGIAMMQHACLKLKKHGTLVLKVRIFDKAQTLGLVALLSLAFENTQVYENARQTGHFAIAYMTKFKGSEHKIVKKVLHQLQQAQSYSPSDIFTAEFLFNSKELFDKFKSQLQKNERISEKIRRKHAECKTAINLCIVYLLEQNVEKNILVSQLQQKPLGYSDSVSTMIATKVKELNDYFQKHPTQYMSFKKTLESDVWRKNL
jgi:hypothetical protein